MSGHVPTLRDEMVAMSNPEMVGGTRPNEGSAQLRGEFGEDAMLSLSGVFVYGDCNAAFLMTRPSGFKIHIEPEGDGWLLFELVE